MEIKMTTGRLEAFSDGVIAIIITITVLLIDLPSRDDWHGLAEIIPLAVVYLVSFIMIGYALGKPSSSYAGYKAC